MGGLADSSAVVCVQGFAFITALAPYVEGVARQQHSEIPVRTSEIAILVVFFEAGSCNRPHTHEHDQTSKIAYNLIEKERGRPYL